MQPDQRDKAIADLLRYCHGKRSYLTQGRDLSSVLLQRAWRRSDDDWALRDAMRALLEAELARHRAAAQIAHPVVASAAAHMPAMVDEVRRTKALKIWSVLWAYYGCEMSSATISEACYWGPRTVQDILKLGREDYIPPVIAELDELAAPSPQYSRAEQRTTIVDNARVGTAAVTPTLAGGQPTLQSHPAPFLTPPYPPQGIIGRDTLLSQVYRLLTVDQGAVPDIQPVALWGMGGIGKTTLAIALGRQAQLQSWFPDGVLWTAIGPKPSLRPLLNGWARALNMDLQHEDDDRACCEQLMGALSQRRVLLLIDDVWEITHGQYFMLAGPYCRTVITTRELKVATQFATSGRTLRVDMLRAEDALVLLSRLAPEAVRADVQSAELLCKQLEGLPLALTLAGRLLANEAHVPHRMQRLVKELIERGEARLQLPQEEGRIGLAHGQPASLQSILGMSIERLSPKDQERFALLSVFDSDPRTWSVGAAAHVWECSVESAEATVAHCIQRGLVEQRGDRYWMHALLWDYATYMLDALERGAHWRSGT